MPDQESTSKLNNHSMENSSSREHRGGGLGMGRGHGRRMRGAIGRPKDFKGTMRKLIKYLKPYHLSLILVVILALISTALTVVTPNY